MCPARHERKTPVTHNDFDLSKVLEQLKSDESGDLVRQMVTFLYQELIDAEATEILDGYRLRESGDAWFGRVRYAPPC